MDHVIDALGSRPASNSCGTLASECESLGDMFTTVCEFPSVQGTEFQLTAKVGQGSLSRFITPNRSSTWLQMMPCNSPSFPLLRQCMTSSSHGLEERGKDEGTIASVHH